VQSTAALLLWLFLRATPLPHEPASLIVPPGDLPASRSAYGWLETAAPNLISSEFDGGGLTTGRTPFIGVHGTAASDATFRFAGLDVTSALRPGTPMLLPDAVGMATIDVTRMPVDPSMNAPGPHVAWAPMDGRTRIGLIEGFVMPSGFAIKPSGSSVQPVAALNDFADGALVLAGEVSERSNAVLSAHWARARAWRASPRGAAAPATTEGRLLNVLGAFTFSGASDTRTELTAVFQQARPGDPRFGDEAASDTRGAAQLAWSAGHARAPRARLAVGYQWSDLTPPAPGDVAIDSALDGSVFPQLFQPFGRERAWRAAVELAPTLRAAGRGHHLRVGADVAYTTMTPSLATASLAAESVNGVAARAWQVDVPSGEMHWTTTAIGAFAADRIGTDAAWLEVGVRFDRLTGSNDGPTSIRWSNVLPYAAAEATARSGAGIFARYARVGARLPAMALAWGDVNAPTARVFRWTDPNHNGRIDAGEADAASSVIQRVGPGASGGLTAIASDLARPIYDVVVGGVRLERARVGLGLSAVIRRTTDAVRAIADTAAYYTPVSQPDKNADYTNAEDDGLLTAYDRVPASYGLGTYTLGNPETPGENRIYALDFTAQFRSSRVRLAFSAAAVAATGTSAARGYRVEENDPMAIGDVFADPNATVNAADARTFFDRGYVGKILGTFDLGARTTLGVIARYQDGQPFSRLAIFSDLSQGPEAVVAYSNGRPTRFTYISTTDVRLQKSFNAGRTEFTVILDAFNVFNIGREVAEYVLDGTMFRETTLIEPPRSVRIGARLRF
jgi:hypothetical protein